MFPAVFETNKQYTESLREEASKMFDTGLRMAQKYNEDVLSLKQELIDQRNQFENAIKHFLPQLLQAEREKAFQDGRAQALEEMKQFHQQNNQFQQQQQHPQQQVQNNNFFFPPFYQFCKQKLQQQQIQQHQQQSPSKQEPQQQPNFQSFQNAIKQGFLVQAEGCLARNDLTNSRHWYELALECPDNDIRARYEILRKLSDICFQLEGNSLSAITYYELAESVREEIEEIEKESFRWCLWEQNGNGVCDSENVVIKQEI